VVNGTFGGVVEPIDIGVSWSNIAEAIEKALPGSFGGGDVDEENEMRSLGDGANKLGIESGVDGPFSVEAGGGGVEEEGVRGPEKDSAAIGSLNKGVFCKEDDGDEARFKPSPKSSGVFVDIVASCRCRGCNRF